MEEVQKNENGTTVPQADGKPKKEDKPKRELTPQDVYKRQVSAYAQGNGQAGITEATNLITGYFDPGTKLVYAIGAVCGLRGEMCIRDRYTTGRGTARRKVSSTR